MQDPEETRDASQGAGKQHEEPVGEAGLAERLRELGYLQDPLTRFLATGRGGRASVLRTHLLVGSKVGVVIGFVLFVLLGLGFLFVGRFIHVDLRDHVLFFGYLLLLCLPFGLLLGLLFAGIFGLYGSLRRRAQPKVIMAARKSAWTTAVLILAYLLLLWIRLREHLTYGGVVGDLGAALVCVAFSLFVGRVVYSAALYLGARRRSWDPQEPPPRRSGLWSLVLLALLVVGAFGFLRVWHTAQVGELRRAQAYEVRPGGRLLWIGIDGLDLKAVHELVADGRLPCLERVLRGGRTVALSLPQPRHPLVFWTDLTTGMPAERHGVESATVNQPRGLSGLLLVDRSMVGFFEVLHVLLPLIRLSREEPLSAALLREKPLHEILAEKEVRTASLNWWLSHPAGEGSAGVMVTERAIWLAWNRGRQAGDRPGLREVNPAGETDLFVKALRFPEEMFDEPGAPPRGAPAAGAEMRARALDETTTALAQEFLGRPDLRVVQVGLWGPNILLDTLLSEVDRSLIGYMEIARRLSSYYESIDERLARIIPSLEELQRSRTLVCLSAASGVRRGVEGETLREGGFCVFFGVGVRAAPALAPPRRVRPYDILPTLLLHLGFPASAEMPGVALRELLELEAPQEHITSFGAREFRSLPTPEENREALRMLRAFGYL